MLYLVLSILIICYLCIYINCKLNSSIKRKVYIEAEDIEKNEIERLLDIKNKLPPPYNSITTNSLEIELD